LQIDRRGRSPLHHAALRGHRDVCELLLEHDAELYLTGERAVVCSAVPTLVLIVSSYV
jgi:ankyrin repeat protein